MLLGVVEQEDCGPKVQEALSFYLSRPHYCMVCDFEDLKCERIVMSNIQKTYLFMSLILQHGCPKSTPLLTLVRI